MIIEGNIKYSDDSVNPIKSSDLLQGEGEIRKN